MTGDDEWVRLVQQRALERALVDEVDARRYFALAGTLDRYRDTRTDAESTATGTNDATGVASAADTDSSVVDTDSRTVDTDSRTVDTDSRTVDTESSVLDADPNAEGVLPAALVSLAVVPFLERVSRAPATPSPSAPGPASAPTLDPWSVDDPTRPAIRRGARLAVRWFDVRPERVAARAGVPEAALTAPGE